MSNATDAAHSFNVNCTVIKNDRQTYNSRNLMRQCRINIETGTPLLSDSQGTSKMDESVSEHVVIKPSLRSVVRTELDRSVVLNRGRTGYKAESLSP